MWAIFPHQEENRIWTSLLRTYFAFLTLAAPGWMKSMLSVAIRTKLQRLLVLSAFAAWKGKANMH